MTIPEISSAEVGVVGTGKMAEAYVAALRYIGFASDQIIVVSETADRAAVVASRLGTRHRNDFRGCPTTAIVAVTPERTPAVCRSLLEGGTRSFLIEKPGALSSGELRRLGGEIELAGGSASMALNRRFYGSVAKARELIQADGGVVAFNFEFSDLEKHVLALRAQGNWLPANFSRWGFINPVHVIDLALFLCGSPVEISARVSGELEWHPAGSEFAGVGSTKAGALFSYWATFSGAGRWRIDLSTRHRKLTLMPIESLQQQLTDSFRATAVELEPEDAAQKPGLVRMLNEFLRPSNACLLPTIDEMVGTLAIVEEIFGYPREAA
jgi:predicted dehydrogenase